MSLRYKQLGELLTDFLRIYIDYIATSPLTHPWPHRDFPPSDSLRGKKNGAPLPSILHDMLMLARNQCSIKTPPQWWP